MTKIVTMGEIMLRLSTPNSNRFVQCDSFDAVYGGSEANVAVSLSQFGNEVYYVTRLPKHEIGQSAVNALKRYGVHPDYIARGGDRVGIYFLETGSSMRGSKVIYDCANSSMALATSSDFDFDEIFKDAQWFHWSGITPAISDKSAKLTKLACEAAKKHGVKVSVDLNYRSKLWTKEEAQSVMVDLMQYVDVCIGNPEAVLSCLGIGNECCDIYHCLDSFEELCRKFPFKYIVYTFRDGHSADCNGYQSIIYNGKETYISKRHEISSIVDRIGGGDAFTAGLIHGLVSKKDYKETVEFAIAAGAFKHTIRGDFNLASVEEIEALALGEASGRVQR